MSRPAMVVNLAILGICLYAVLAAVPWALDAKLFPLMIGIPVILLCLIQLRLDLSPGAAEVDRANAPAERHPPRAVLNISLWFAAFFLLLLVLGFKWGLPLFLAAYLLLRSRESWWLALSFGAVAWLFISLGMIELMKVSFPTTLLELWLARL